MQSKLTIHNVARVEFEYTFTNIDKVTRNGELSSESVQVEHSLFWLTIAPYGDPKEDKDEYGLYLWHEGPKMRVEYYLTIFKPVGSTEDINGHSITLVHNFPDGKRYRRIPRLFLRTRYMGYESLTVDCTIKVVPTTILQLDYSALCLSDTFSDVCFKVEDQTLPAHKMLLALHSPVFKAMLKSGMTEATSGEIVIDDFSAESFKAFLTCLYSQSVCLLSYPYDICVDISKLADKYQVSTLLCICLFHLNRTINVDTCIDLLSVCHTYEWTKLKEAVIDFVSKNKKWILKSQITALKNVSVDLYETIVHA